MPIFVVVRRLLNLSLIHILEHCYVNLSFENVSVLAEQFLIEFRLVSFTVKSRRYVDFSKAGYLSPVFTDNVQMAIFERTVESLFGTYEMCIRDRLVDGYCYTQLTDVETEQNGLLTYDRTPKLPLETICAILNLSLIHIS